MRFVIGDIHSQFFKLKDVLYKSKFNYDEDLLITLGDLVDRGCEPINVIYELMKIKNTINIIGNHDQAFYEWMKYPHKQHPYRGHYMSDITMTKWIELEEIERGKIQEFIYNQKPYYVDENQNLFVHAGLDLRTELKYNSIEKLTEDRTFFKSLLSAQNSLQKKIRTKEEYNKIFIGHTPTVCFKQVKGRFKESNTDKHFYDKPINIKNVWNIDTGAGFDHKLSMMNIDTLELFQSF